MKFSTAIQQNNMSLTDNGAVTLATSGNPHADLFFLVGASRGKNIVSQLNVAYSADPNLTNKIMLWARDCRGGAGERELFRQYLRWLEIIDPEATIKLIQSGKIQEVGRWDDLLVFFTWPIKTQAHEEISKGFSTLNTRGLVAKWMPRQGPIAKELASWFHLTPKHWRQFVVLSTKVVEQQMCAKQWPDINFEHVPSVAAARYQKAFTKHVPEQYGAYRNSLVKGTAKINANTVYPYDVVKSAFYGDEKVAEAQWKSLPNYLDDKVNILPIIDVSGSMGSLVPGTNVSMMDVAVSLGLYISEKQQGDFHNIIMNFSGTSEIIQLHNNTLIGKIDEARGMNWGMNTNLNTAFQNLLVFGKRHNVSNENMPNTILIISDMEFDMCSHLTNMESIELQYKNSGYTLPKIVFWCLNGRKGNVPVKFNQQGVALISGFSPSIMKSIFSGKSFSPYDIMLATVNIERYNINVAD